MALDLYKAFGTGGLKLNRMGSAPLQQGPGLGYFGAQDVYRPKSTGNVLGTSTSRGVAAPISAPQGQPQQSSGQVSFADTQQPQPQQPTIDYDALIAPALQALEGAVAPAQSEYEANVSGIETTRTKGRGQLQASLGEAQTSATRRKGEVTQQSESAIDEARRQFSEMQQGLQSRYGKTTGTGAFAETYLGGQTLRNIAGQRQALAQAVSTIDDRLEQVRTVTDIALKDVDEQAGTQKLQAKSSLDNALQQIRMAKGELLSRKTELAQQAMQFYQQQVAQVNANNTAFKQQLYQQQAAAEQRLQEARSRAGEAVQKLQSVTMGSADTGYFGASFNPATGEYGNVTQFGNPSSETVPSGAGSLDEELKKINQQAGF